jgi:hypothetical protein
MRAFIIALPNIPESVASGVRCAMSAQKFGLEPRARDGVWRDVARERMKDEGLRVAEFDQRYSNPDAVIGNFMAQYAVWQEIAHMDEPAIVMEHDAVVVAPLPEIPASVQFVTLGRPSFGRVPAPREDGIYPLFSRSTHLAGAHGYYLTPAFAEQLVSVAQRKGVMPVDIFISPQRFAGIMEAYPWPIEAHDSFTTIQKRRGCVAKHNFCDDYRIL